MSRHCPRDRRPTCPDCLQPVVRCVCALLPRVATRTRIVILQHPRERHHPFGTARLAARAFTNAALEVAWPNAPAFALPPPDGSAWLLYPGPSSVPLEDALAQSRPRTLVLVDGTWHTAPTLLRRFPELTAFPQVRLAPLAPSRYRIRAEPALECLSTLESLVAALTQIEPETAGLAAVLEAFDTMVERQLAMLTVRVGSGQRRRERPRPIRALPRVLTDQFDRCVLVYGESVAPPAQGRARTLGRAESRRNRSLLQWVAVRPETGEHFQRFVQPSEVFPSDAHLAHMGCTRADFADAVTTAELGREFSAFAGRDAVLFAWNQSTLDLARTLREASAESGWEIGSPLKGVLANVEHRRLGTLEQAIANLGMPIAAPPCRGRAAVRLGQCASVVQWLREAANRPPARAPLQPAPLSSPRERQTFQRADGE